MVTTSPRSRAIRSRPARIVSVCVAGHPVAQERFNTNRIELVSKVAREIRRRPDWDPLDAVVFPAGFFRLGAWFGPVPAETRLEMLFLEETADVCRGAAHRLSKRSPGCIIVAGIDTPRPGGGWRGDQLTAAFDMDGVVGLARKVFPVSQDTDGWGRAPFLLFADDYSACERFITLPNGETALLSACYDAFVLTELALGPTHKRSAMRYLGVDTDDGWEHLDAPGRDALLGELNASIRQHRPSVHLVAIHGFKRPGGELPVATAWAGDIQRRPERRSDSRSGALHPVVAEHAVQRALVRRGGCQKPPWIGRPSPGLRTRAHRRLRDEPALGSN